METQDFDSTLIRRGAQATSYGDMVVFASTVERRSLVTLLQELPGLARLSETKFSLVSRVLRRRFRGESFVDREQLRVLAAEIAESAGDRDTADRIRLLFQYTDLA